MVDFSIRNLFKLFFIHRSLIYTHDYLFVQENYSEMLLGISTWEPHWKPCDITEIHYFLISLIKLQNTVQKVGICVDNELLMFLIFLTWVCVEYSLDIERAYA